MNTQGQGADCPKFLSKLQDLMDGVMSKEHEKQFLQTIEKHKACFEKYQIAQSYKEFLSKKLQRKCCSDELRSMIFHQISNLD